MWCGLRSGSWLSLVRGLMRVALLLLEFMVRAAMVGDGW